jgi:hypothetical protein
VPSHRVLAGHEAADEGIPGGSDHKEMCRLVGQTRAIRVDTLHALLKPLVKHRLLKIPGVDADKVALGWDFPVEACGWLSNARKRVDVHVDPAYFLPAYFLQEPPPAVILLGSENF